VFVITNAATQAFFDYEDEEPPDGSVRESVFHPDVLAQWIDAFRATIRKKEPVRFAYVHATPNKGAWLEATVNLVGRTDDGMPLCSFCVDDMTERRTAEHRLIASEQYLQMAVESARIGVWDFDFASDRATWSPQMCAIHGVAAFDGRVSTALHLMLATDRDSVTKPFRSAMRRAAVSGAADVSVEYRVVVAGDERWVRTLGRVYADEGEPTRMAGVSQDVTDEKRHDQALVDARTAALDAKERAEEAVRLKTGIISNMSHEIRTPLTAILGFADLLAEDLDDPDPEVVGIIQTSAHRLLDTLNSVLYFAQLESGIPFEVERFDVVRVVRDAVHPYASRARAKQLALTVSAPSDPLWVATNRDAVDRLVGHLVSNAVKFTREGRVDVRAGTDVDCVWIEVADTGIGMAPTFVETAFEPFRQESAGMARAFEGSGLGLSIVRRLIDLLSARLDVQSEQGVGSTLRVWLPLRGAA
jgi:PAS domain S-box-containing protein